MGLFDWLFGKSLKSELRLFRSDAGKYNDLQEKVAEDADAGRASLILYHFPDIQAKLLEMFPDADLMEHLTRNDLAGLNGVTLVPVNGVPESFKESRRENQRRELPLQVHLAESFPVCGPDEEVLHLAAYATPKRPCLMYVSLDEPWMEPFVGRVKELFDRFGWAENECLSGTMLARSAQNAQKKLSREYRKPWVKADSAAEWLEKNRTRS